MNIGASINNDFEFEPIQKLFSVLSPIIETIDFGIIFALNESSEEYALKDKIDSPVFESKIFIKYSTLETILFSS